MAIVPFNNPKRVLQILWLAAGSMFALAIVRSLTSQDTAKWVSNRVVGMMGDHSRLSMEEHMRLAEASWAKTVKQRHDLISADYGTVDKMPL